jgi:hypothetical protein
MPTAVDMLGVSTIVSLRMAPTTGIIESGLITLIDLLALGTIIGTCTGGVVDVAAPPGYGPVPCLMAAAVPGTGPMMARLRAAAMANLLVLVIRMVFSSLCSDTAPCGVVLS